MNLYTFIMDHKEGTYVSQIKSNTKEEAMRLWIANLDVDEIDGFTETDQQKILNDNFLDEEPTELTGIKNTWHFIVRTQKEIAFVNFVKTVN